MLPDSPPPAVGASIYITSIYITSCLLFVPLHCLCNAVFIGCAEYRAQSCYRIMLSLGLLNTILLLILGIQGLVMLFHWYIIEDGRNWAVSVLGSLFFLSFDLLPPLILLLACNRLWVLWGVEPGSANCYCKSSPLERYTMAAGVAACWLYGAVLLSWYLSPYIDIYYFLNHGFASAITKLGQNSTLSSVIEDLNFILPDVSRVATFLIYLVIVVLLVKKVGAPFVDSLISSNELLLQRHTYSASISEDTPLLSKPQRAVLIQSGVEFGVSSTSSIYTSSTPTKMILTRRECSSQSTLSLS